jgi:hypothetical protein
VVCGQYFDADYVCRECAGTPLLRDCEGGEIKFGKLKNKSRLLLKLVVWLTCKNQHHGRRKL